MSLTPPPPKATVRVGLMVCDKSMHPDIFKKWLKDALPPDSQVVLQLLPYNAYNNEFPTSEEVGTFFDVIMVTGSPADAFGDDPWIRQLLSLVQHVYNKYPETVKLFGICFGHQIISRALGGVVERNSKLEYGLTRIQATHMGKTIYGVQRDSYELQQIHQDHVPIDTLSDFFSPGRIYLLGSSIRTPNQGFVKIHEKCEVCEERGPVHQLHEHIHILTTQGHPEFSDAMATSIFHDRARSGAIRNNFVKTYFGDEGPPKVSLLKLEDLRSGTVSEDWLQNYDGTNVVGKAFWKMFGVRYDDLTLAAK